MQETVKKPVGELLQYVPKVMDPLNKCFMTHDMTQMGQICLAIST